MYTLACTYPGVLFGCTDSWGLRVLLSPHGICGDVAFYCRSRHQRNLAYWQRGLAVHQGQVSRTVNFGAGVSLRRQNTESCKKNFVTLFTYIVWPTRWNMAAVGLLGVWPINPYSPNLVNFDPGVPRYHTAACISPAVRLGLSFVVFYHEFAVVTKHNTIYYSLDRTSRRWCSVWLPTKASEQNACAYQLGADYVILILIVLQVPTTHT